MAAGFLSGRNVLVTGAGGMVGSHLCEKAMGLGANVVALVRSKDPKSYFSMQGLDGMCISAYGDLKDCGRMRDIVTRYEIEHVFHLGAQPIVGTAISNPLETFKSNIMGTANILEAVRSSGLVKSCIVASSDKAYGASDRLPYTEDMPLRGEAPYDVSKSCTDLVSLSYAKTYSLPIAVTRFGNIYGPGDLNFNRLVPGALKAAILGETLEIRSDGKMVREFLYVDDVADGYIALAENIGKGRGQAFNFGSGDKMSVIDAVDRIGKAIGKKIERKVLNKAKSEIKEQCLSCEKAKSVLGWKARTGFGDGIRKTHAWYSRLLKK